MLPLAFYCCFSVLLYATALFDSFNKQMKWVLPSLTTNKRSLFCLVYGRFIFLTSSWSRFINKKKKIYWVSLCVKIMIKHLRASYGGLLPTISNSIAFFYFKKTMFCCSQSTFSIARILETCSITRSFLRARDNLSHCKSPIWLLRHSFIALLELKSPLCGRCFFLYKRQSFGWLKKIDRIILANRRVII